jgi:hypothetical protein
LRGGVRAVNLPFVKTPHLGLVLLVALSVPAVRAQGIYAKAIEKAQRTADQESYGGQLNFPDGVTRFYVLGLDEISETIKPGFRSSPGFVKLSEGLRAAGKAETADTLTGKLNGLVESAVTEVFGAARGGAGTLKLELSQELKVAATGLTDALRKAVEPALKEKLRALVLEKAAADELPAAFDAFVAASGAKLPDAKAALATLEEQAVTQAIEHVFGELAARERSYRADPRVAADKVVTATFNTLK